MNTKSVLIAGIGPQVAAWQDLLAINGIPTLSLEELQGRNLEIGLAMEVTNNDLCGKKERIEILDQYLPEETPILVSTLSVTATEAASWTSYPQRVCGFGTFLPLEERNLIEVAPALQTHRDILERCQEFFSTLGKETEVVEDEVGLVFPRILSLIINEAAFTMMQGTAEARDIDTAMKLGTNYPYGPLEWADRIGLDEVYGVIQGLHRNFQEERYRPAPILRKRVLAGWTGEKAGLGFYPCKEEKEGDYANPF